MTRTAVFELVSHDPSDYGTVKTQIDIPWNCRRIKYWVDSVNTFANTKLLTTEDYIDIESLSAGGTTPTYTLNVSQLNGIDYNYVWLGIAVSTEADITAVTEAFGITEWDDEENPWLSLENPGTWTLNEATIAAPSTFNYGRFGTTWTMSFHSSLMGDENFNLKWEFRNLNMAFSFEWNGVMDTNFWFMVVTPVLNVVQITKTTAPGPPIKVQDHYQLQDLMVCDIGDLPNILGDMITKPLLPRIFTVDRKPLQSPLIGFKLIDKVTTDPIEFRIIGMSHRARLITGFYDAPIPNPSDPNVYKDYIQSPSAPYVYHGNMMYLVSKNGNAIHSANVQHPGVLLRINEFLMSTLPVIIKPREEDRDYVIGDGSSMREIELRLVDRWFEPVKILNPMVVTIKMEPIMEEQVWYG